MHPLLRPLLTLASTAFATIFIAFGINPIARPAHALSFFDLAPPAPATHDRTVVDSLMIVYGARDIFMGLALYAVAVFGSRKALGWILVAAAGVAGVDGAVVRAWGTGVGGEWAHWGYAPAVGVVGLGLVAGLG